MPEPQDVCEKDSGSSSQTFPSLRGEPPPAQRRGFLDKDVVHRFTKMKTWLKFLKGKTGRGRVTEKLSNTFDSATIPWEFTPRKEFNRS